MIGGNGAVSSAPTVSVVVPTYNRRDRLERVLNALFVQQTDVPYEIVVVSDGSTDGTDDYLSKIEPPPDTAVLLRHVRQDNRGPAAARNRGVEIAAGEIVVFIDDDVVACDRLLQAHVDAHRRLGDDYVVIGPMLDPIDHRMSPWVRWEQEMLQKQYSALDAGEYEPSARQFYTGNASLRREHLIAAGGFDSSFRRAEDVELAYRLDDRGLRFFYENSAIGYHYATRSFEAWRSAAYTYGRNDVIFARDRGRSWMMSYIAYKFTSHHPAIQAVTTVCVRWRWLRRPLTVLLGWAAAAVDRVGFERAARYALSAYYSIEYHSGIAEELGSPNQFFEVVSGSPE